MQLRRNVHWFIAETNQKKVNNPDFNFRRSLNVVCFLLGDSPASEFYMSTFRNTLFHIYRWVFMKKFFTPICLWRWKRYSVPKRRYIKFRRREITQKKAKNELKWILVGRSGGSCMAKFETFFTCLGPTLTNFIVF